MNAHTMDWTALSARKHEDDKDTNNRNGLSQTR